MGVRLLVLVRLPQCHAFQSVEVKGRLALLPAVVTVHAHSFLRVLLRHRRASYVLIQRLVLLSQLLRIDHTFRTQRTVDRRLAQFLQTTHVYAMSASQSGRGISTLEETLHTYRARSQNGTRKTTLMSLLFADSETHAARVAMLVILSSADATYPAIVAVILSFAVVVIEQITFQTDVLSESNAARRTPIALRLSRVAFVTHDLFYLCEGMRA